MISNRHGISVSSLGRHSQHSRKALALPIPPGAADVATDTLSFLSEMGGVLSTLSAVEAAARDAGASGVLLNTVRVRTQALESIRRACGIDPTSVRDKLQLFNAVVKAVGYLSAQNHHAAGVLAAELARDSIDPKNDYSARSRAELAQLSEHLATIADNGSAHVADNATQERI